MKKSVFFLSSTIVFYGCSFDNGNQSEQLNEIVVASKSNNYSGKDFFKGIFFINGEIAKNLSIITNNYDISENMDYLNNQKEFDKVQNEIIQLIEDNNPAFFDDFLISMQSKNPMLITQALKNAKNELIPVIQDLLLQNNIQYDISKYNLEDRNELNNIYEDYVNEVNNGVINNASIVLAVLLVVVAAAVFYVVVLSEFEFGVIDNVNNDLFLEHLALEISSKY